MKTKQRSTEDLKEKSKSDLLAVVAAKIKGRTLFPEKVERDRELVRNASAWPLK